MFYNTSTKDDELFVLGFMYILGFTLTTALSMKNNSSRFFNTQFGVHFDLTSSSK